MTKFFMFLLAALLFEAVGVVFLSSGLKQIGEMKSVSASEIGRLITRGATNRNILTGVLFEAIFFGALLFLLSRRDVSLVWPLTSLGFAITALAAKVFLKEEVSALRWAGVLLIVCGAGLITWSEKQKTPRADAIAPDSRHFPFPGE